MTMTTPMSPPAEAEAVGIHQAIGGSARLADCVYCDAGPWEPCVTGRNGADGDHLARFARAERRGLIGADDLDLALATAGDGMFSGATVIYTGPARPYLTGGVATPGYLAA